MQTKPMSMDRRGGSEPVDAACVSVVIPAFNASAFLAEALESVANQTARPGEVIVIDDGSTDDTVAIARSFGATVIVLTNGGPSAARNAGIHAASGEYIAFLDADDIWAPNKLAVQLAALRAFGRPAFSFTDYRFFDERGTHGSPSELRRNADFRRRSRSLPGSRNMIIAANGNRPALSDSYTPPSSVLVRRADALAVGGFNEELRVTEDYEFHLRLLRIVPALVVTEALLSYRRHAGQATAKVIPNLLGFLAVARLVEAWPGRYPPGDRRFILRTGHLRQLRIGMQHAREGDFPAAAVRLGSSLKERWTLPAFLALVAVGVARSAPGGALFEQMRKLWKRRPGRG